MGTEENELQKVGVRNKARKKDERKKYFYIKIQIPLLIEKAKFFLQICYYKGENFFFFSFYNCQPQSSIYYFSFLISRQRFLTKEQMNWRLHLRLHGFCEEIGRKIDTRLKIVTLADALISSVLPNEARTDLNKRQRRGVRP